MAFVRCTRHLDICFLCQPRVDRWLPARVDRVVGILLASGRGAGGMFVFRHVFQAAPPKVLGSCKKIESSDIFLALVGDGLSLLDKVGHRVRAGAIGSICI